MRGAVADLEPEPTTRLAALDGLNRVIRIGSFSKTLSASLRCGYIAARVDRISDLADLQVATGFVGASPVAAEAIAHVLAGGGYRKHLDEVHRRLARKRRGRLFSFLLVVATLIAACAALVCCTDLRGVEIKNPA